MKNLWSILEKVGNSLDFVRESWEYQASNVSDKLQEKLLDTRTENEKNVDNLRAFTSDQQKQENVWSNRRRENKCSLI